MILNGAEDAEVQGSDLLCLAEHREGGHWLAVPQSTSSLQQMGRELRQNQIINLGKLTVRFVYLALLHQKITHKPE